MVYLRPYLVMVYIKMKTLIETLKIFAVMAILSWGFLQTAILIGNLSEPVNSSGIES
jgi:sensor domain CHASE-containing protein